MQTRLDQFSSLFVDFEKVQNEIEDIIDDGNIDQQLQYRKDIENQYYGTLALAQSLVIDFAPLSTTDNTRSSVATESETFNVKLPQINLPKFDGNFLNWLVFRDTFRSLIHHN